MRAEDLAKAAQEMAGVTINISGKDLRKTLDARAFLTSRATDGSVHPRETRAHQKVLLKALIEHQRDWQNRRRQVDSAIAALLARARDLAGS